jgi:hypothetical protein
VELLRADQFVPEPGDLVHRESLVGRVVVLAVFACIAAGWLGVPLLAGPWGFLAWPVGLLMLCAVVPIAAGVRRGFRPGHWAVRLRPSGIALRLRSYLNDDLPAGDPTVCWIPVGEIHSVRRGRTQRVVPGQRRDQLLVEQHLDIQLAHAATQALAEALTRERQAPRRGRAHHQVHPVRLVRPDVVRVTWRDPRIALQPGLDGAMEFLLRYVRVEEPLASAQDWRELSDEGVDELVLELASMGSRLEAVKLLHVRRGMELAHAREFVDQLAA